MIVLFDHVFSYLQDNQLHATVARFERAGFLTTSQKVRHALGQLTGFAFLTGSYLEFLSVVDEGEFKRHASLDDHFYRANPLPIGICARSDNVRLSRQILQQSQPGIPPVFERPAAELKNGQPAWTYCNLPPRAFPGPRVFALQYHGTGAQAPIELRQGPNTIFALGGVTFCSEHPERFCSIWARSLAALGRVTASTTRLRFRAQRLEWVTPEQCRERIGQEFPSRAGSAGGIAAVKLFASHLGEACRFLGQEGFHCRFRSKTAAYFALDPNTGYAFEVYQASPVRFLQAVNRGRKPTRIARLGVPGV